MLEAKASDARGPECVDKVWDEQVDGAWAPGKASVSLLTTFLKCIQERDSVEAERAAREILEAEPNNRLVQDLLDAMKAHDAMETAAEEGSDEDEEEDDESEDEEEEEDSSEDEQEGEDGDEESGCDADAKDAGGE